MPDAFAWTTLSASAVAGGTAVLQQTMERAAHLELLELRDFGRQLRHCCLREVDSVGSS